MIGRGPDLLSKNMALLLGQVGPNATGGDGLPRHRDKVVVTAVMDRGLIDRRKGDCWRRTQLGQLVNAVASDGMPLRISDCELALSMLGLAGCRTPETKRLARSMDRLVAAGWAVAIDASRGGGAFILTNNGNGAVVAAVQLGAP